MAYKPFKFIRQNPSGRDFVVGDIHGHFSALEALLEQTGFDERYDRVFSVGDLVDRGPESYRVIEFLNYPWFYAIMGNHEKMLLDSEHNQSIYQNWVQFNGGEWWLDIPNHLHQRIRHIVKQLPLALEVDTCNGRVGIVHADTPLGIGWKDFVSLLNNDNEVRDQALWSRSRFRQIQMMGRTQPVSGIDMIVFGHTPVNRPIQQGNIIYIDTGATYLNEAGLGKLTLLEIHPSIQIYQLDTKRHNKAHSFVSLAGNERAYA